MTSASSIDYDRLLKLRLVVARQGEMDGARWWTTQGVLGRRGAVVYKRGFPATHHFAQARVVFAVAASRCREVFDPPGCMTLWNLPAEIEDEFEEHWQRWLAEGQRWTPLFEALAAEPGNDLLSTLGELGLIAPPQSENVRKLHRASEGQAVPIPGTHTPNDDILTLLAAGFSHGEPGRLAIPYARLED